MNKLVVIEEIVVTWMSSAGFEIMALLYLYIRINKGVQNVISLNSSCAYSLIISLNFHGTWIVYCTMSVRVQRTQIVCSRGDHSSNV